MNKFFTTIAIFMLAMVASAQNFCRWDHDSNDGYSHQCYDIIEMSDGNFMVDDDVFNENGNDIGINLFKITPEGVAIDSAFIPGSMLRINGGFPRIRDPFNDNSNIFTSFYNEDGIAHYKALYINDDLEIVNEIETELNIGGTFGSDFRAFINHNNDIVIHGCDSDTTERFIVLGLDGTTKFVSQSIEKKYYELAQRPFFMINKSPVRCGFITCRRTSSGDWVYIEVYDEEFNRIEEHKINTAGQYTHVSYYAHMGGSYLDEWHFLLTTRACDQYINDFNLLIKYNHDFQVVEKFQFADGAWDYLMPKNIAVTDDGRIYVVWSNKQQSKRELTVECLDFDLNLLDEVVCLGYMQMVNYGLIVRSNGGLAISGWLYDSDNQFDKSSKIYAVIFDETLSTSEISYAEKPLVCYPNPAKDIININFDENSTCNAIDIYALDGRLVETHGRASLQTAIDISILNSGVYVMKLRMSDGKEFSERIVKQ